MGNKQHIIIIGAARSGTKFLRDIFTESQECSLVPYDVNYIWRYGNEDIKHDQLSPEMCNDKIRDFIINNLEKIASRNSNKNKALFIIEKTVANTIRVPYIETVLNKPKYIHLVRDGRDVVESSSRMWGEKTNYKYLFKKLKYFPIANYRYAIEFLKNLFKKIVKKNAKEFVWGVKYPDIYSDIKTNSIVEICSKQWKSSVISAQADLNKIDNDRVYTIRYEDLVSDPKYIEDICSFIGIKDNQPIVDEYIRKVRKDNVNKWEKMNNKDIDSMLNIINETLTPLDYTGDNKEKIK